MVVIGSPAVAVSSEPAGRGRMVRPSALGWRGTTGMTGRGGIAVIKGLLLATTFAALFGAASARAAGDPDAAKGLVADHCVACHRVPGYEPRFRGRGQGPTPAVQAPSFEAIARDPSKYTAKRLRAHLRKPPWPMRGFVFSARDIENLVAFIEALRRK